MLLLMGNAFQENFTWIRFTKAVFFFFEWILSPGCAPVLLLSFHSQPPNVLSVENCCARHRETVSPESLGLQITVIYTAITDIQITASSTALSLGSV